MSAVAQVRVLAFNDEEIGMGFNSTSGLAVGTALEHFAVTDNPTAPGGQVASAITIVSTHQELQELLGFGVEAQGRYGLFSASLKAKFSAQTNFNSSSTFVVASIVVSNSLKRGHGFQVTDAADKLLKSLQTEVFGKAFGDSFVRGLQTGGEFYAVVRITSVSTTTQTNLATTLQAEYNGVFVSGSFKAAFDKSTSNAQTMSEYTATMYQRAGTGAAISPTVTIEEVTTRFKNFPQIAATSPAAYQTEVATYDTLPLPLPTPQEQQALIDALADATQRKLDYIQHRNDLDFALRFPQYFEDPPPADALAAAAVVYVKLINAVTSHAIALSKGETPPLLFDPGALNPPLMEPLPFHFKKKDLGAVPKGVWLQRKAINGPCERVALLAAPDGKLYAVCGSNDFDRNGRIEQYDPVADDWSTYAPMPVCVGMTAVLARDEIFVTGQDAPVQWRGSWRAFSLKTNAWRVCASMPSRRRDAQLTCAGNKIYAIGGQTGSDIASAVSQVVERYDPDSDTWATMTPRPLIRNNVGVQAAANGKIYVVGGWGIPEQRFGHPWGQFTALEEYDPATDTWTTKAPMRVARSAVGVAAGLDGRIYAIGSGDAGIVVEAYDPASDRWTDAPPLNVPRRGPGIATASDGTIYVAGGYFNNMFTTNMEALLP